MKQTEYLARLIARRDFPTSNVSVVAPEGTLERPDHTCWTDSTSCPACGVSTDSGFRQ